MAWGLHPILPPYPSEGYFSRGGNVPELALGRPLSHPASVSVTTELAGGLWRGRWVINHLPALPPDLCSPGPQPDMAPGKPGKSTGASEDPSVTLFREYLRIDTVHPKPDYGEDGGDGTGSSAGIWQCGDSAMRLCSSGLWTWVPESSAGAVLIVVLRSGHVCALSLLAPLVGAGTPRAHPELLFASSSPVPQGPPFPHCPGSGMDACGNFV